MGNVTRRPDRRTANRGVAVMALLVAGSLLGCATAPAHPDTHRRIRPPVHPGRRPSADDRSSGTLRAPHAHAPVGNAAARGSSGQAAGASRRRTDDRRGGGSKLEHGRLGAVPRPGSARPPLDLLGQPDRRGPRRVPRSGPALDARRAPHTPADSDSPPHGRRPGKPVACRGQPAPTRSGRARGSRLPAPEGVNVAPRAEPEPAGPVCQRLAL